MAIKQRVLSKMNDEMRHVCGTDCGSAQIEFTLPRALLQKGGRSFSP
jgi:hypothetical protein